MTKGYNATMVRRCARLTGLCVAAACVVPGASAWAAGTERAAMLEPSLASRWLSSPAFLPRARRGHPAGSRPGGHCRGRCGLAIRCTDGDARLSANHLAGCWIGTVNRALEESAVATLLAFIVLDIGSALCLLAAILTLGVKANADFALAYALAKSVRAPRLALDASGAAFLVRLCPALKAVRVSLILDEANAAWEHIRGMPRVDAPPPTRKTTGARTAGRTAPLSSLDRATAEVRRLTEEFGLAYMTAKNIIGPVSILLAYGALTASTNVHAMLVALGAKVGINADGAGLLAGQMALASTMSTLLFPAVVFCAARLAPLLALALRPLLPPGQSVASD